jgi:CTP:molybdopterin cytidylyltransferase MocA
LKAARVAKVGAVMVEVMAAETVGATAAAKVRAVRAKAVKAATVAPGMETRAALLLGMPLVVLAAVLATRVDRPQVTPRAALAVALVRAKLAKVRRGKVKQARGRPVKVRATKARAMKAQPIRGATQTLRLHKSAVGLTLRRALVRVQRMKLLGT